MFDGDFLELRGQRRCGERPWTGQTSRLEPAPRHEEIKISHLSIAEQIGLGVADPQQIAGANDRFVLNWTIDLDQFGRLETGRILSAGSCLQNFLPGTAALTSTQLPSSSGSFEAVRQLLDDLPRPIDFGRLHPGLFVSQVQHLGGAIFEQ